MFAYLLAVELVRFTGPDNQPIDINPAQIVDIRPPRGTDHFAPGTKCLLFMSDGKPITVQEDCGIARLRLGDKQQ